jgi:arylsulfatase A-like enzyme
VHAAGLAAPPAASAKPPNILFIMMDDVGIDQLQMFNPLAPTAVSTPVLDQIAAHGVKFNHFYTLPECSPSRTAFFTGRMPLRTGVTAALLPEDLPAAQISPYEMTTPKVLATKGYKSAMLGKYHLGGPDNNPDGYRTPAVLGWDYYSGNLSGGPPNIDVTLGGQIAKPTPPSTDPPRYSCGFPIQAAKGGCWFLGTNKQARFDNKGGAGYDGKECATLGGIAALNGDGDFTLTCGPDDHCKTPDLTSQNAYYAWERVTVQGQSVQRDIVRKYMTTAQTDESIAWIKQQSKGGSSGKPWMATVSYNSDHILYQPPPDAMLPPGTPPRDPDNCDTGDLPAQRALSDQMIEAMDRDIGRLLVSVGLATQGPGGAIHYTPDATNTMIVIVGDNGSFLPSVKYPFNLTRSKGSVYETGIRTPLIVAGPLVTGPAAPWTRSPARPTCSSCSARSPASTCTR